MSSRRDWLVRSLFTDDEVDGTVCLDRVSREGRRFATTRFSMHVDSCTVRADEEAS